MLTLSISKFGLQKNIWIFFGPIITIPSLRRQSVMQGKKKDANFVEQSNEMNKENKSGRY